MSRQLKIWGAARIFEHVVLLQVIEEVGRTQPFSCDRFEAPKPDSVIRQDTLYPKHFQTMEPFVFCLHTSSSVSAVGDLKKLPEWKGGRSVCVSRKQSGRDKQNSS